MTTMIMFIGIPASGKSTFYANRLSEQFERVSLDELHTRHKERDLIERFLTEGKSFVIDNTNPSVEVRKGYIEKAKAAGYTIQGYFFQSIVSECVLRNELREGKARIPAKAITAISNKLEMPSLEEGFDEIFFVKITDGSDDFIVERWREENEI